MNQHVQNIKSDMDSFQASVMALSAGVKDAAYIWKDPKYNQLSAQISDLAGQSKDVLTRGDKLCSTINRFFDIAAEDY